MTSKVTVESHPKGYPVLVEQLDYQNNNPIGNWKPVTTVNPGEKRDFVLHSTVQFKITELPQLREQDQSLSN